MALLTVLAAGIININPVAQAADVSSVGVSRDTTTPQSGTGQRPSRDKPVQVPIGSADFYPSPARPIGFRGDGSGNYEGATPPIEWWDGTPVQKEILVQPQGAIDEVADKPIHAWVNADRRSKNILWKAPAPGWGYAHPIVVGPSTSLRAGKRIFTVGHPYWVACYDADTGKELWKRAMTPILAAGMEPDKAEKLRKVLDLALAMYVLTSGGDYGGAAFLSIGVTKKEKEDPAKAFLARMGSCERALAMLTKYRGDVEAAGDPKLISALDQDIAGVESQIKGMKAAASPQEAIKIFGSYGALQKALAAGYGVPFNGAWYAYTSSCDASLTSDGERIYGTMAQGQSFCYDLDGNLLWARQDGGSSCREYYDFNRTPLVIDGVVCVRLQTADKTTKLYHWLGLEPKTGKVIWDVPFGGNCWSAPVMITLTDPNGATVKALVTPLGGKTADGTMHGSAIIRARDGKILGYCQEFKGGRSPNPTWHDGILVFGTGGDGGAPPPVAMRVKMTGPDTVSTEIVAVGGKDKAVIPGGEDVPVAFGPYLYHSSTANLADLRTFTLMSSFGMRETATKVGPYFVGRTGGPGDSMVLGVRSYRADKAAQDRFQVVDVSDVRNPRLVSDRNVLSFAEMPVDHVIATYLTGWDPLAFTGYRRGLPAYFGTDLGGVSAHGDRIYLQSAAFIYCIGPAIKGTPKDDPKVVTAIRAAKGVDEVAQYLTSDSAQYRYETVKKARELRIQNSEVRIPEEALQRLAKTDPYEEIRADALRVLGLETNQPGGQILTDRILAQDIGNIWDPRPITDRDLLRTMSMLGKEADPVLVAQVNHTDAKHRVRAAILVEQCGAGGEAVRDALLAMMDDSKDEGALRLAGMAARALVIWPADEKVRAAFAAVVKTGYMKKGCFTQMQAYTYLTKYAPEEQKAVLMSEFAAQTPDNPVRAKAVEKLLERQAFDVLGKVIQESTGRTQSSLLYSLCQAAGSAPAGARKFAVEQMKKKLETKANPDELGINALPILKAEAGPLLPLLKALNSTNPGIVDAIAGIEAAVAAEGKK